MRLNKPLILAAFIFVQHQMPPAPKYKQVLAIKYQSPMQEFLFSLMLGAKC